MLYVIARSRLNVLELLDQDDPSDTVDTVVEPCGATVPEVGAVPRNDECKSSFLYGYLSRQVTLSRMPFSVDMTTRLLSNSVVWGGNMTKSDAGGRTLQVNGCHLSV